MRPFARGALGLGVVFGMGALLAGCGPLLTAGIVAGIGSASGGGSSGSAPVNGQTSVTAAAATGDTNGGTATIEFSVQDPEGDQVTVEVRYSTDPNASASELFTAVATGTYTDAAGNPVTPPLTAAAAGTTYRFLWNTAQDLGTTLNQSTIRTQLVIGGELAFTTAFFSVDNTSSPMISIVNLPALPGGASVFADRQNTNSIPFQVSVLDADAQPARVDVLFSTDGGVTFPATNVAVGTFKDSSNTVQDPTALPTTQAGLTYTFDWNSGLNGIDVSSSVVLRFTAQDSKVGAPRDSSSFAVNNADFSGLVETPGPSAEVDRVEVEYVLIDEAGGNLDVVIEYSINGPGGPFRSCSQASQPPTEGLLALQAPVSPGQEHSFLWNSFADFRALGAFTSSLVVLRLTPYRRSTQVFGKPVLSGAFSVDQRLVRTVINEGVDFSSNTLATSVELPFLSDIAVSAQVLDLAAGPAAFLGEVQVASGVLSLVPVELSDAHRVELDASNNRYLLDRESPFGGETQDVVLRRIDQATGIATELLRARGVPFQNPPNNPGQNAALTLTSANRVMVSHQTSGMGHVLRSVGTLGGPVQTHSFGGTVAPSGTPVSINARAQVSALAADTSVVGELLAGLRGASAGDARGIYRTTDRGVTWSQRLGTPGPITDLDADYSITRAIASEPGQGVHVSFNDGATWALTTVGLPMSPQVTAVTISNGSTFYTATTGAVFETTNAGGLWAAYGTGFPGSAEVRDLLVDSTGFVYAATDQGVWRSNGAAWTQLAGIPNPDVRSFTIDANGELFVATAAGVSVFEDPGWTVLNSGLPSVDTLSIASDPSSGGQLVVGTRDAGAFETFDGGQAWEFTSGGLSDLEVSALTFDNSRVFAGTANAGVFELQADKFVARPNSIITSALLRISYLAEGPIADTYIYGDAAANHVVALNLGAADVTITNVLVPAGTAVRIAGTGTTGGGGNGVPAISAGFSDPVGVACHRPSGRVVFTETRLNQLWQIDSAGIVTPLAGAQSFVGGFSGDNGAATLAEFNEPTAVELSPDGNTAYVVDGANFRVRRIQAGLVTTVAGTEPPIGDGKRAQEAVLSEPVGVLAVANGLLIADTKHHRVRLLTTATGLVSTVAGNGGPGSSGDGGLATQAEVGSPQGLALAPDGSVLIAQRKGFIRRLRTDGVIETVVGSSTGGGGDGGLLLQTKLNSGNEGPIGLALRSDGMLLIGNGVGKIWAANLGSAAAIAGGVNVPAGEVRRVVGDESGAAGETPAQATTWDYRLPDVGWLSNGDFVFVHQNELTDPPAGDLWRVGAATGSLTRIAGGGADLAEEVSPPTNARISAPSGLVVVSDTFFVVQESGRQVLRAVNLGGGPVTMFGVTVPANSAKVLAGTLGVSGAIGDGSPGVQGRFSMSSSEGVGNDVVAPGVPGLIVDGSGNLLFADPLNDRIRGLTSAGVLFAVAGGGRLDGEGLGAGIATLSQPLAIGTDASSGGYAVFDGGRVRRVDLGSTLITTAAGTGSPVAVNPQALPTSRVSTIGQTGFSFVRDLVFPDSSIFSGTTDNITSAQRFVAIEDTTGLPTGDFTNAYPGMVLEELDGNGNVLRTAAITSFSTGTLISVSFNEDKTSWSNKTYRVNDAFDLSGPRAISPATVNGASLLAVADTRNHAVFIANVGTATFTCSSGYPSEPLGVLTIGPGQIARVAGSGHYEEGSPPPAMPTTESIAEQVTLGFPMGVQLLPSGLLVIADTLYWGNGRIVALNLGAAPVDLGGTSGIPPGGVAVIVPVGTARRPFSLSVRGKDLAWSEHGLPNSTAITWRPQVRYQSHAGGAAFGVSAPAGMPVTVLGGPFPYTNGVALQAARGVAFDSTGTLYVVDTGEAAVYGLDPSGVPFVLAGNPGQLTILGDSTSGSSGEGGPGSSALLRGPYGIAVDEPTRAVLILDTFNFSVRRVRRFP